MSEELQNESTGIQDDFELEQEQDGIELSEGSQTIGDGSELATDSEAEHEENTAEVNQQKINEAINKQHRKFREEERKRIALEQELEQLRAQAPQNAEPIVPAMPDPFDDDYEAKVAERDKRLIERQRWEVQRDIAEQQRQQAQQQALAEQQKQINETVSAYVNTAKKAGISEQDLQAAGNTVASYGLSDDLALAILGDQDGPLITMHLASNPLEIEKLSSMNLYQAANYINQTVRAKTQSLKPRQSNAPKPPTKLKGSMVGDDSRYSNIKGAIFE